jgi:hypothetical protein
VDRTLELVTLFSLQACGDKAHGRTGITALCSPLYKNFIQNLLHFDVFMATTLSLNYRIGVQPCCYHRHLREMIMLLYQMQVTRFCFCGKFTTASQRPSKLSHLGFVRTRHHEYTIKTKTHSTQDELRLYKNYLPACLPAYLHTYLPIYLSTYSSIHLAIYDSTTIVEFPRFCVS